MNKLNIGIMAHVDAGKTTVTEGFLFHSGIKSHMGNVDKGTTTTDSMSLEKERGMTIRSAAVSFQAGDTKINLIDTPGHMDFIAEVERCLSVLDGVVLVISAREGVQPQTRAIFTKIKQMGIPALLFINKIDRMGVDLAEVYGEIRLRLTEDFLVMQEVGFDTDILSREFLIRERSFSGSLGEDILVSSDELLEKYLSDTAITQDDYERVVKEGVNSGKLYPVYHGAALQDKGVKELMDAVTKWFAPKLPESRELSAYVYKVMCDDHSHRLFYIRVFSGSLIHRMRTSRVSRENREGVQPNDELLIRNLFGLENGRMVPESVIDAGDTAVIMDAENLNCGDWIGVETRQNSITQTEPLLNVGIKTVIPAERRRLLEALQILTMEDPYMALSIREETEEIRLKLFGNLQKEIIHSMLAERFGLETEFDSLTVVQKEKPLKDTTCIVPIFTAGNLFSAGVGLKLEPLPEGGGFQYVTRVSFGDLSKSFQNGVREGVEKGIRKGLQGQVVDTKVTFMYSDFNSVCSTPADFRRLAEQVVYKALRQSGVEIMEPVMKYVLTAPLGCEKKMISQLVSMNALMEETLYTQTELVIKGTVTLESCKDFPVHLLTLTEGSGVFETCIWQYRKREQPQQK